MAQAINLTDMKSALGAFYRDHKEIFWEEMFYDPKMATRFNAIDGITDEKVVLHTEVDFEVLPGHDKRDWSPQNDAIKFGAQILKTRECKVDLEIFPAELHRTWLGKYKQKGSDPFDLPFEEFIMQAISKKAMEKLYLKAAYGGVYNAAGNSTVDVADGFLKKVSDLVTATTITEVVTGVISDANIITAVEAMAEVPALEFKTMPEWELKVSDAIFNMYWKKRRATYPNLIQAYTGNIGLINELPIEGYNVTLVREVGLGTSQRMILTPKKNMGWLFDSESDIQNLRIQENKRGLDIMMDFKAGFGFLRALDGYLIVNDQA